MLHGRHGFILGRVDTVLQKADSTSRSVSTVKAWSQNGSVSVQIVYVTNRASIEDAPKVA